MCRGLERTVSDLKEENMMLTLRMQSMQFTKPFNDKGLLTQRHSSGD